MLMGRNSPRMETNSAPKSFLSLELFGLNIFSSLLFEWPRPTLTVSEIRSFWESLTDVILSDYTLQVVLQVTGLQSLLSFKMLFLIVNEGMRKTLIEFFKLLTSKYFQHL